MGDVFLDTNVLVCAFDGSDKNKQARALSVLAERSSATISTQVLLEWFTAVTRKLTPAMEPARATTALETLARLDVVSSDAELVIRAARTTLDHQLSIWDAMIVEVAVVAGCRTLLTEDLNDWQEIRGVRIENPFR